MTYLFCSGSRTNQARDPPFSLVQASPVYHGTRAVLALWQCVCFFFKNLEYEMKWLAKTSQIPRRQKTAGRF